MSASAHPFKSEAARKRYLERYALRAAAWPVPSTEREVDTSFGRTFVRVSGPEGGAPLLMLPGIGSSGLTLAPLVAHLSGPLRTFVIDNIHDNGRSVSSRPITSAADFTTWLDEVRAGLGLEKIDLLGLSYGGWISAQYALRFPERLGRVILLAPAGTTAQIPWGFIWRAILCLLPGRYFMRNFMAWMAVEADTTPELRKFFAELVDDAVLSQRCFKARKMVAPMPLSDEQWRAFRPPALFLAGDREVNFPPHEAVQLLKARAPAIQAELLAGAGHDLFATRAGEVSRRVLGFLRA